MRLHIKTDTNLDSLFPYIFFHNGTDVDRLGENILGRELVSGKHDVSNYNMSKISLTVFTIRHIHHCI